jgi:hypothetical protein
LAADGWTVSEAGDIAYNGSYTENGTLNGEPAYTNGSKWLYWAYEFALGTNRWCLGPTKEDPPSGRCYWDAAYYSPSGTDLPSTWSVTGAEWAIGPPPTLVAGTSGITISGTVYTSEDKSTNIGANKTVALAVGGSVVSSVETGLGGTFYFSGVSVSADQVVSLYVDNESLKGSLITQTLNGSSNISGLELYTGHVAIAHQSSGPMTNTLLAVADNAGDDDLLVSVNVSNEATFTAGNTVWVVSGKTYTPGGNVSLDDLKLEGTFSPESNTISINGTGSPFENIGTFNYSNSTLIYTGTGSVNVALANYYNLRLLPASGSTAYTLPGGTLSIHGNFVNGNGSSQIATSADTNDPTLSIAGSFTNSAAAGFTASDSATLSIGGNYTNNGTFTDSSGILTLNGSSQQTITANGTDSSHDFNNLTIANTSAAGIVFADSLTIKGMLTDITPASRVTFHAGSTYSVGAINISGGGNTLILLRSSTENSVWYFTVSSASPTVSYVDVRGSNASLGSQIIANDSTSIDSGNNTNWLFPTAPGPVAQIPNESDSTDSTTGKTGNQKNSPAGETASGNIIASESPIDPLAGEKNSFLQSTAEKISSQIEKVAEAAASSMPVKVALVATAATFTAISSAVSVVGLVATQISLKDILLIITNYLMALFAAKRKDKMGKVFDPLTGKPVERAVVELFRYPEMKMVATALTDKDGHFYFVVKGGDYTISVIKPGYIFPSVQIRKSPEFSGSYLGQVISIKEGSGVINASVPVDPSADYGNLKSRPVIDFLRSKLFRYSFSLVGTALAIYALITNPNAANYLISGIFVVLWTFEFSIINRKLKFSQVLDDLTHKPISLALVRLKTADGRSAETFVSDEEGKVLPRVSEEGNRIIIEKNGYNPIEQPVPGKGFVEREKFQLKKEL